MSARLQIHGKTYLPSSALASTFGYSPVYVSSLARSGAVTAEKVGGIWYVDEVAFSEFLVEHKKQKAAYQEEIRRKRKLELRAHTHQALVPPSPHHTLALTSIIFTCVLCVGLLGYTIFDTKLTTTDLAQGVSHVTTDLTTSIAPEVSQTAFLGWIIEQLWPTRTIITKTTPEPTPTTTTPSSLIVFDNHATPEAVASIREQFSDPVSVIFATPDSGIITPLFKDRVGSDYRFILVPLTTQ